MFIYDKKIPLLFVPHISDDSHMDVVELASQDIDGEGNTGGVFLHSHQAVLPVTNDDDADLTLGKYY